MKCKNATIVGDASTRACKMFNNQPNIRYQMLEEQSTEHFVMHLEKERQSSQGLYREFL